MTLSRRLAACSAALWLLVGVAQAGEPRVALVRGVPGAAGDEFIGALRQGLGPAVAIEEPASVAALGEPPALIVAVGATALSAVLAERPAVPVLATLLPRVTFEAMPAGTTRLTALFLDQPFPRQLAVLRAALPQAKRIGVLLGPDSQRMLPWLERAARETGHSLLAVRGEGDRLRGALQQVIAGSDVLLVLPDPQVFNASTLQGILLESYRAGVPLFGVSPAYTRAGALLSVAASPVQQGAEAAQMVREALAGALPEPRHPRAAEVHVNRQVARSLGLVLPDDESLRQAARGGR